MQFTSDGMNIDTFAEIFASLVASYKEIYGEDIDLAQNTPDGQRVGIEAKARADMQAFILAVYNSFDPDLAEGIQQDKIAKVCGITRQPATKSLWDITVTSSADTVITGYIIEDDIGQQWTADLDILAGDTVVTFTAVEWGAVYGIAGSTFSQVTVFQEITGLSAVANSTTGTEEETAEDFRIRRNKSVQNPSTATVGALFSRIANIVGVTDLAVYENAESTTDVDKSMGPHEVWAVVEGGSIEDIAEVIARTKPAGIPLKGSVTTTHYETVTKQDGSDFIYDISVSFDRPITTQVYATATVTRKNPSLSVDIAAIKSAIAAKVYGINEHVLASEIYQQGYTAGTNFILTDMLISDDGITYTDGVLTAGYDVKFEFDVANIDITEVV